MDGGNGDNFLYSHRRERELLIVYNEIERRKRHSLCIVCFTKLLLLLLLLLPSTPSLSLKIKSMDASLLLSQASQSVTYYVCAYLIDFRRGDEERER